MISIAVSALGGCVDNNVDGGIFITKNVAATGTSCAFTADDSEPFLSQGTLDTRLGGSYVMVAQLKSRISAALEQIDQRTVLVQGANISLTFPNAPASVTSAIAGLPSDAKQFRQLMSAPLEPNGGISDVSFVIVPNAVSRAVFPLLTVDLQSVVAVANITVDGVMGGGTITSQVFAYPVNLTTGLAQDRGACPLPMDFGTIRPGNPCNVAQDAVVDCCREATGQLLCPAM
jgi:hypothetical protein